MRKKEVIKPKRANQLKLSSMSEHWDGNPPPKSRKDRTEHLLAIKKLRKRNKFRKLRKSEKP